MAEEILDQEAAIAVLKELSKMCAFQVVSSQDDDDDQDILSKKSHRSHDNVGYVASPLIDSFEVQGTDDMDAPFLEVDKRFAKRSHGKCDLDVDAFQGE